MTEKTYQLALVSTPHVGAQTAKTLIRYCGDAQSVFESTPKQLKKIPGIGDQIIAHLHHPEKLERAEKTWCDMQREGIRMLFFTESEYPDRLRPYFDCPAALFVQGKANLQANRIISIVGTRKPTPYGLSVCRKLIEELRPFSPVILSGLAYGIDICAHRAALDSGLSTIGVMAHGHRFIYPESHRPIANKMLESGGLISEYPPFVYPEKEYFPMRNRIVAGACDALIVIETGEKGGSIITANLANGYEKDVFAIPGRLNDNRSKGCHLLIKSHRAALLENVKDLEYILGWGAEQQLVATQQSLFPELNEDEKNIVALLQENGALHIDQLAYQGTTPAHKLPGTLLELECKGVIASIPGQRYVVAAEFQKPHR